MTKEEIEKIIDERVEKILLNKGLVRRTNNANYYNPSDMHDSWYKD